MFVSEILHERSIKLQVRATTKEGVIEELVDVLIEAGDVPMVQRNHVLDIIAEREKAISTGVGNGVALPHGATDRIDDIVGALGISKHGIDFGCHDGIPASIIVLLVIPRRNFQEHILTMASIARLMGNKAFRPKLMQADSAQSAIALIEEEENKHNSPRSK